MMTSDTPTILTKSEDRTMKKIMALLFILPLLLGLCVCSASAEGTEEEESTLADCEPSPEWIGTLGDAKKADQLFVVAGIGQTTATVSLHEKDADGVWRQIMSTPGYIGKYGLGKTREGDGMSPVGTFSFNCAFGIAEDPGCAIPYRQVNDDDYWSGDQREGHHYNEMVSIKDLPDLDLGDSEHIADYVNEYQYCLNISYNAEGTPGLGSAIFLHCFGPIKPYTGGCVAIPKDKMITVMRAVRPDCVVVIDSLQKLSPETWTSLGFELDDPVAIDRGNSALFSDEEMDSAISLIRGEFDGWTGCMLHSVRYAGDECSSKKNLDWMNSLRDERVYTQCICFLSDFHSPAEAAGAWEPDAEYTDWEWWLARIDKGEWELVTWGY